VLVEINSLKLTGKFFFVVQFIPDKPALGHI